MFKFCYEKCCMQNSILSNEFNKRKNVLIKNNSRIVIALKLCEAQDCNN